MGEEIRRQNKCILSSAW